MKYKLHKLTFLRFKIIGNPTCTEYLFVPSLIRTKFHLNSVLTSNSVKFNLYKKLY